MQRKIQKKEIRCYSSEFWIEESSTQPEVELDSELLSEYNDSVVKFT